MRILDSLKETHAVRPHGGLCRDALGERRGSAPVQIRQGETQITVAGHDADRIVKTLLPLRCHWSQQVATIHC